MSKGKALEWRRRIAALMAGGLMMVAACAVGAGGANVVAGANQRIELTDDVPLVLATAQPTQQEAGKPQQLSLGSDGKVVAASSGAAAATGTAPAVGFGGTDGAVAVPGNVVRFHRAPPPEINNVKAYVLIDANTGHLMAAKNASERLFPASLTKVLSLYIVAAQLKHGGVTLNDQVHISKKAWQTGGSRMFVRVDTQVPLFELVRGVAIVSGNDATVALAEHIGGTEENFVRMMNQTALRLQMQDSSFADCNGLHDSNYSTAIDLAKLTSAWVRHFPEYYEWFKEKWFVYNGIKQSNRNRLLWRDETVDGVKTGYTSRAGYCLIASANQGDTRLVAVVLGADKEPERLKAAQTLLRYGFHDYESRKLFSAHQPVMQARLFLGKKKQLPIGLTNDLYITATKDKIHDVQATVRLTEGSYLRAPIVQGAVVGTLKVRQADQPEREYPLVALATAERDYWWRNLVDYLRMRFLK